MPDKTKLKIQLISFGYKYGSPKDVNFLWDVRFLPNPYWVEDLRPKTGKDDEVSDYVISSAEGQNFISLVRPLLLFLIQQNIQAETKELVLALGCTGGRHRSVSVVEVLSDLVQIMPVELYVEHRDIKKDS